MRPLLFALVLLLALPAAAFAGEGALLDQVVAVISPGGRSGQVVLVTRSDVELEARVLLVSRGAGAAASASLPDDTLAATLDWLVSEYLLLSEAEQLGVATAEPAAVEKELEELVARFGGEEKMSAFLADLELTADDLRRILRRRLVVDGYVGSRLRLGMRISEAEVRRAWEARREELGEGSFEWARPMLRAQLEREKREALVAALVADLRSRAEVRVLVDLGGEKSPPGEEAPWYLPVEARQERPK